jgi:hypothetical protein
VKRKKKRKNEMKKINYERDKVKNGKGENRGMRNIEGRQAL